MREQTAQLVRDVKSRLRVLGTRVPSKREENEAASGEELLIALRIQGLGYLEPRYAERGRLRCAKLCADWVGRGV